MSRHICAHHHAFTRRPALSLVEVVISIVLVSGVLVAALNTAGGVALARAQAADRSIGYMLGSALMSEILQGNYREPDGTPLFGLEVNDLDVTNGTRVNWDDIDDYHNLNETTIERKGGKDYADRVNWARTVRVEYVRRSDVAQTTASDEGLKRITVTVTYLGVVTAQLTAITSNSLQEALGTKIPKVIQPLDLKVIELD
jgi:hypothetical protein